MKEPEIHLTQWENITFNRSLMNIGDGANKALKSSKSFGKFKHVNGHWVYWTKVKIESLSKNYQEKFKQSI